MGDGPVGEPDRKSHVKNNDSLVLGELNFTNIYS